MATTITSIDTQIAKLTPTFQTAIKAKIDTESTPLKNVQTKKDSLDVRKSIYTDIKTNFDGLQSAIQALISSESTYGLGLTSSASVTPGTAGTSVFTAASTESALPAEYDISVTQLAKAQSKSTALAYSPDAALGKSGMFWLGGNGTSAINLTANDTVTASGIIAVGSGQRELGTGNYTVETRTSEGSLQFRLVNADGTAVSIRNQNGDSYTNAWQSLTDGTYDTGRGLSLTLSATGTNSSTTVAYTAAGTFFDISASDSLRSIALNINSASQPDGRDFKASIVANKLVLTSSQTGENHSMLFTDDAGLGISTELQTAQNAKFTVNNMSVSRAANTNLTDVVDGVTLNLSSDAAGKSAHLSISATADKAAGLVKTMVDKFNTALTHLKDKLASTPSTVNGKTTYTRGPITGDSSLSGLRQDILSRMSRSYTNSGSLSNLSAIGISFDKDMKLTFDSAKFSTAYKSSASNVTALLDTALSGVNTLVSGYAGTQGSLSKALTSITSQSTGYDKRIAQYNTALTQRKQTLYNQYVQYQSQIINYGYTQQYLDAMYGTSSSTSTFA